MSFEDRYQARMERRKMKNFVPSNEEEAKYYEAYKRVRKIKGFYTHLAVFIVVNTMIIITKVQKIDEGESIWHAFYASAFWGIGLLGHALSVFLPNFILGSNWEERKIQELMEKEKRDQLK